MATYYLDASTFHAEDITTETLAIALRRTVDGVRAIAELHLRHRDARFTPGPTCSWCSLRDDCEGGRQWRDARAEAGIDV